MIYIQYQFDLKLSRTIPISQIKMPSKCIKEYCIANIRKEITSELRLNKTFHVSESAEYESSHQYMMIYFNRFNPFHHNSTIIFLKMGLQAKSYLTLRSFSRPSSLINSLFKIQNLKIPHLYSQMLKNVGFFRCVSTSISHKFPPSLRHT